MNDRELMQQALDTLYDSVSDNSEWIAKRERAVKALRDRLAQQEQKPVVLMDAPLLLNGQPLYTHPPQRPWVGLTEPELHEINPTWPAPGQHWDYKTVLDFVQAIEAKLKEKNT